MVSESPLLLGFLLCQDMILISMLVLYLSCARNLESLLGAGLCFYFRHLYRKLNQLLFTNLRHQQKAHPFSFQPRHGFNLSKFLKGLSKSQQQDFSSFLVYD